MLTCTCARVLQVNFNVELVSGALLLALVGPMSTVSAWLVVLPLC